MAKSREPKSKPSIKNADVLEPIDISKLGGEDDPCFGKLYDLKAMECKTECGDAELCQIAFMHGLKARRLLEEEKTDYKDLATGKDAILAFYNKALKNTGKTYKARTKTCKKYNINQKDLKQWISEA